MPQPPAQPTQAVPGPPIPPPVAAQTSVTAPIPETRDVAVPEQRGPSGAADPDAPSERVRVVLSERKRVATPVRTVEVVQEGIGVGQLLRSSLIGAQLTVSLWFAAAAGLTIGSLPLLFALFPAIGRAEVFGLRLPWLLLGVLVYPFLLGLGWWHARTAERVEQNFADHVQD